MKSFCVLLLRLKNNFFSTVPISDWILRSSSSRRAGGLINTKNIKSLSQQQCKLIQYSPLHTQIESNSEPTMESLARALIGFVLIYQLLPMAGCKVIRQRDENEKEISASEVNYERSNLFSSLLDDASMEKFNETSIKYYTNTTLESSRGSGVNSSTHM